MNLKALRDRLRGRTATHETAPRPASTPHDAEALTREAERLAELGRVEEAADSFVVALAHDPSISAAWIGYGKLMRAAGRLDTAIDHLRQGAALAPGSSTAWVELAFALNQAGRTSEAAAAYEKAIAAEPDDPAAYVNLGLLALTQLADPSRAEMLFRRAIAFAPGRVEAQVNLGLALHEQGRSEEALTHYDRLLQAQPRHVEYRWHRASVQLATGDFERGWDGYEARKEREGRWRAPPPFAEWDGTPFDAGSLLVYAEQGLGDEIMFASCVPDVVDAVGPCVLECDQRVAELFRRSFPSAVIHGVERSEADLSWLSRYPDIRAQCAIGSLPRHFRRSRAAFGDGAPYLVQDPARVARWRALLGPDDGRLRVGIAWRGGTYKTRRELRSTTLEDWAPVIGSREGRFFALQRATGEELETAPLGIGESLQELPAVYDDTDELAAAIAALDLVITVQGTVAHLAGALGRPVWVALNRTPEWRYLSAGDALPWYGSARLFRQSMPRSWTSVFEALAAALPDQRARTHAKSRGGASC